MWMGRVKRAAVAWKAVMIDMVGSRVGVCKLVVVEEAYIFIYLRRPAKSIRYVYTYTTLDAQVLPFTRQPMHTRANNAFESSDDARRAETGWCCYNT